MRAAPIGQLVEKVDKWDPAREATEPFTYVDLSSVDQDRKAITGSTLVSPDDAPSRARQLVRLGDVLVSTVRPNLNAVALVSAKHDGATASTGFCVLRPKCGQLDGRYLYHWVRSPDFVTGMVQLATGASYPAVSDRIVKASEVPLPPIEEQRRIAAVLDAADALRAKRRQALAKLDTLTQAIFIDMFGDLDAYPKFAFASLLTAPLRNGISPSKSGSFVADVLTLSAITGPAFDSTAVKESTFTKPHTDDKIVSTDDFLICRGNGNVSLVGRGKWPTDGIAGVAFPDTMIAARCDADQVAPGFLEHLWDSGLVRRQLEASARTTNGTHKINQTMIESVVLPLPPIGEQRQFHATRAAIGAQRHDNRAAEAGLDRLFASLQQRAFRGKL